MCQTTLCRSCGTSNSVHQIWCFDCGQPIPWRATAPRCEYDPSESKRTQLYDAILQDLDRLRDAGKVSPLEFKSIHRFYQRQVQLLDQSRNRQERSQAQFRLIQCAREAAQSDRFQEASLLFEQAAQCEECTYPLAEMRKETEERSRIQEYESKHKEHFSKLLKLARQQVASEDTTAANDSLHRARKIASDLSNPADLLQQIEELEARLQPDSSTPDHGAQPSVDTESVIVANLVDPSAPSFGSSAWQLECAPVPSPQLESLSGCSDPSKSTDVGVAMPATGRPEQITDTASHRIDDPSTKKRANGQTSPAIDAGKPAARSEQVQTFDPPPEVPSTAQRLIDHTSQWSSMIKPFLLDNVGWFVGAFLVVAGFVVLIVTFWSSIEQNRLLMHSIVYCCLAIATGMFFYVAYFMRRRYPELESSSNVLLVIVALLVPLVFAAALLTSFVPPSETAILIPMS